MCHRQVLVSQWGNAEASTCLEVISSEHNNRAHPPSASSLPPIVNITANTTGEDQVKYRLQLFQIKRESISLYYESFSNQFKFFEINFSLHSRIENWLIWVEKLKIPILRTLKEDDVRNFRMFDVQQSV